MSHCLNTKRDDRFITYSSNAQKELKFQHCTEEMQYNFPTNAFSVSYLQHCMHFENGSKGHASLRSRIRDWIAVLATTEAEGCI